jgi:NAD(P)-dependent dehydrogenase (short-subunit alcohol dehydrogenase family)
MAERFENGYGGLIAVVTGGGTGMGRELVRQLTAQGCDVATCDVIVENLAETVDICTKDGNPGAILTHMADVSDEAQVLSFRDAVAAWRPHVNVVFNNAGIGGGGSIVESDRTEWEKTFGVCWYGVYYTIWTCCQHKLSQRVLGITRTQHCTHRIQRCEICCQRFHRSSHYRFPDERTHTACIRCHAWSYWYINRYQLWKIARQ